MRSQYSYPARIDRDEEGRYQVRFADLPDALDRWCRSGRGTH